MQNKSLVRFFTAVAILVAMIYCSIHDKKFLSLQSEPENIDGFVSQMLYIKNLMEDSWGLFQAEPLYWVHALRMLVALPFEIVYEFGGAELVAILMLAIIWPLLVFFDATKRPWLGIVLPLAMIVLSFRAVLVFVGVGYLLLYVIRNRSSCFLLLGYLFVNLSSGSVLTALAIGFILSRRFCRMTRGMVIFLFGLLITLVVSVMYKYVGFMAQDVGYEATVGEGSGVLALLSRSTVFVSLLEGDYLRFSVYVAMLLGACYAFAYAAFDKRYSGYKVIFLVTIPSFMLEGLGVVSLIIPMMFFLSGVPISGFGRNNVLQLDKI